MAFKLAIGNNLEFKVKGTLRDGGNDVPFAFTLLAKRIPIEEYRASLSEGSDVKTSEFIKANITGWRDQKLVHDDTGKPAAFEPAALDVLLTVVSMEGHILRAYLAALEISDGKPGRAGN